MQKSLALSLRVPVKETNSLRMRSLISLLATASLLFGGAAFAQTQYESSTDFAKYAMKLRENALLKVEPKVIMSPTKTTFTGDGPRYQTGPSLMGRSNGLAVGDDNPDPAGRRNYIPVNFVPRQNPFYVALPYNDVEGGHTKSEAAQVIPWFKQSFIRDGQTVLKSRWIAIRHNGRVCYAQWEDCGPFRTDHWQYVFGNERPRPNLNLGAGLDVSPAVRDYLGLGSRDACDWRFVEFKEISPGPWSMYGENNTFVILRRQSNDRFARRNILNSESNQ